MKKEVLIKEIENTKKQLGELERILENANHGIEINKMVLNMLEKESKAIPSVE